VAEMRERERLAALGAMAAGLAHEIRNPLGAIKGAAQYLATEKATERAAAPEAPAAAADAVGPPSEFLDIIVEEVDRLNAVVSQFLDYARPFKGERQPVDVNAVIERVVALAGAQQTDGQPPIQIALELGPDLGRVLGDAEQLKQVFLNLVLNAQEALAESGDRGPSRIAISSAAESEHDGRRVVAIAVSDNGPGISPDNLTNIFVPFFTTKEKGTGLGLAICQRIVEHHGGRLSVESVEGKGATFTVRLFAAPEEGTETRGTEAAAPLPPAH